MCERFGNPLSRFCMMIAACSIIHAELSLDLSPEESFADSENVV